VAPNQRVAGLPKSEDDAFQSNSVHECGLIVPLTNKPVEFRGKMEAPPGFEPGMEVLQIS